MNGVFLVIKDELLQKNKLLLLKVKHLEENCELYKERVRELRTAQLNEAEKSKVFYSETKKFISYAKSLESRIELLSQSNEHFVQENNLAEMYEFLLESSIDNLHGSLEKFRKAPSAKAKQSFEYWKPYREQYEGLINKGKQPAWAENEIKKQIIRDESWPIKNPKRGQYPHRTTLHRQLVTKRK